MPENLVDHSAYDDQTVQVGQVSQHPATDLTLYARIGEWVVWLALGVLRLVLVGVVNANFWDGSCCEFCNN